METDGCSAADLKMNLLFMKCTGLMTSVTESLLKGPDQGGQGQWPGHPFFLPIPRQETRAGCQVPKKETVSKLMVTHSRFGWWVLHTGREYVSVCQLWGEGAGERARLPFWSLCLKQCGSTERSTPTQLKTPNKGLRHVITMADTPYLTDTVAIFVKSYAWQTPIIIFFSFLQLSDNPPRLQGAVQCPAFTTPKDFIPSLLACLLDISSKMSPTWIKTKTKTTQCDTLFGTLGISLVPFASLCEPVTWERDVEYSTQEPKRGGWVPW